MHKCERCDTPIPEYRADSDYCGSECEEAAVFGDDEED